MKKRERINWYLVYLTKRSSLNDENTIEFRWSGVQEEDEEDIVLANFVESLQNQTDENFFSQKK